MDIYPLIIARLRDDTSLIDRAIDVLDRWEKRDIGSALRRRQWRDILMSAKLSSQGREALVALLSDSSEGARRMKDFAPFAGVLSREERRRAFLSCTYDH